jgi:hypothetical protein
VNSIKIPFHFAENKQVIYLYELIMINLDKGNLSFYVCISLFFAQHLSLHLVLREVKK